MSNIITSPNIQNAGLFNDLTQQEKDNLLKDGHIRTFTRGEHIFHHSDPVNEFYLICEGNVRLFRSTPDGHEKTIDILTSGQTLCEGEILDQCTHHRSNATTIDKVSLISFPASWLHKAAQNYQPFALNLLSLMAKRTYITELEAEHRAIMNAPQLVACFMQRICLLYDYNPKGFDLPYSKTLIASRIGMELETFSRTLSKLKEHGITVKGNHVQITDIKKVGEYVCDFCSISNDCPTHNAMKDKQ